MNTIRKNAPAFFHFLLRTIILTTLHTLGVEIGGAREALKELERYTGVTLLAQSSKL